jgi:hypothetical protein
LCLLLTACGDESVGAGPAEPSASGDGLTPRGTTLAAGESARVPVEGGTGVVDLTVTTVDPGDPDDLDGLPGKPYYIRLEARAVSGDAADFFAERFISARTAGERLTTVASPATVGPCSWERFESSAPGATMEPCITTVVEEGGATPEEVVYAIDGEGFSEDDPYVTWTLG